MVQTGYLLPVETRAYVPKVLNGAGQVSNAMGAVRGSGVSQANLSKVTSDYQTSLAKLNAEYSNQAAKAQIKGSLASTGKNVDTGQLVIVVKIVLGLLMQVT